MKYKKEPSSKSNSKHCIVCVDFSRLNKTALDNNKNKIE